LFSTWNLPEEQVLRRQRKDDGPDPYDKRDSGIEGLEWEPTTPFTPATDTVHEEDRFTYPDSRDEGEEPTDDIQVGNPNLSRSLHDLLSIDQADYATVHETLPWARMEPLSSAKFLEIRELKLVDSDDGDDSDDDDDRCNP
jgi:hypothetical protein